MCDQASVNARARSKMANNVMKGQLPQTTLDKYHEQHIDGNEVKGWGGHWSAEQVRC